MTYIPPDRAAAAGPRPETDGFAALMPVALAFLAMDGEGGYPAVKREVRRWAKDDPFDALIATVLGGGLAFYLAEHERNPGCATPLDGILYIATCLSVGYDNLFPMTQTGHALASMVQTFGPGLAGMAFDAPAAEADAAAAELASVNRAILARLEDIVSLLEAQQNR